MLRDGIVKVSWSFEFFHLVEVHLLFVVDKPRETCQLRDRIEAVRDEDVIENDPPEPRVVLRDRIGVPPNTLVSECLADIARLHGNEISYKFLNGVALVHCRDDVTVCELIVIDASDRVPSSDVDVFAVLLLVVDRSGEDQLAIVEKANRRTDFRSVSASPVDKHERTGSTRAEIFCH